MSGGGIDATNSPVAGLAQPVTGDHTLTAVTGYFTNTNALSLVGSTVSLSVQLYTSPAPGNVFAPVPGATCTLAPPLTGIVAVGSASSCTTTGLSIPITSQTQAILVVRADVTAGIDIATTLQGYWSAGLALQ